MSAELLAFITPAVAAILGTLASLVAYMIKRMMKRIYTLESKAADTVTRPEARELIKDKTEPLRQQMKRIDEKLDKIINIMLSK